MKTKTEQYAEKALYYLESNAVDEKHKEELLRRAELYIRLAEVYVQIKTESNETK